MDAAAVAAVSSLFSLHFPSDVVYIGIWDIRVRAS